MNSIDLNKITRDRHAPLIAAGTFLGIGWAASWAASCFIRFFSLTTSLGESSDDNDPQYRDQYVLGRNVSCLTWLMTTIGIMLPWKAARRTHVPWLDKVFVGALFFLGWGLFNLIEGIIDHHMLNLPHVYEAQGQFNFDCFFLLSGIVFITGVDDDSQPGGFRGHWNAVRWASSKRRLI